MYGSEKVKRANISEDYRMTTATLWSCGASDQSHLDRFVWTGLDADEFLLPSGLADAHFPRAFDHTLHLDLAAD